MRKTFLPGLILLPVSILLTMLSFGQKKPLDPSVYDHWENIGEKLLSPDGKYLVYTVVPQEGDGRLVIRATGNDYAKEIPRGAMAAITADSRWLVFHIKAFYKDIRDARIHKKTPEASPKDTLAWIRLGTDDLKKIARVKSFRVPEKEGALLAYLLEKPVGDSTAKKQSDSTTEKQPARGGRRGGGARPAEAGEEGTDLVLRNLAEEGSANPAIASGRRFPLVSEYQFSKKGNTLVVETTSRNGDSTSKALVLWVNTGNSKVDTVLRQFHDARNYALDEAGSQLAFVAERDSATKALVKFYRLWYYTPGMDSAVMRADRNIVNTTGFHFPPMPLYVSSGAGQDKEGRSEQMTVSPDFVNYFSKDGSRLFLGLAPIRPPKDTNLVDFETARLDVWTYKDDFLSPQQLVQLNSELKRSYLAMLPTKGGGGGIGAGSGTGAGSSVGAASVAGGDRLIPLADGSCESVTPSREGDGRWALGMSSKNYRIQQQWEQNDLQNIYLIDLLDGSRRLVQEKVRGEASFSPEGKYIFWYDWKGRNWYTYEIASGKTRNITTSIKVPLYDELDDHPDDPPPHGTMGWQEGDRFVYLYDRYDIWQCDPTGAAVSVNLTRGYGRRHKLTFRNVDLEDDSRSRREERDFGSDDPIRADQLVLFRLFDRTDMSAGLRLYRMGTKFDTGANQTFPFSYSGFIKAKNNWSLVYLKGSYDKSNDIYSTGLIDTNSVADLEKARPLSHINPQQSEYNWLTAELHHWKMFDGKMSEGLLYKPENFDSTKKYPIIFYFYERDAETRYQYMAPQPVRASINVPYFVSNGYLVFDPDIFYKTGQPGEDAYNSVISAVRYLSRFKWVDTTKIGIQGHSWGGYQVAYLITRTNLFAAAEAGAPVANMTSAYGGIRWSAGISRQFQYEKSQSRIGSTLWQRPDLYIKNSPLFRADKITTPLLMMHNDADGAVPWYQGIEYFSALRRLGKKVWLMQYNGEDHGLGERRNRKDWSMRLSQYFGYYLKGEPPARWITDGVPATLKGIDWGLEVE